ncbi:MAG: CpsD/CapB family tyrosine-protein kinase [Candidatus Eisenbacteria bacterium]
MKTADRLSQDWVLATEIHKLEARLWRQIRKEGQRVILFTSAARGDGKSTTVAYLATALGLYPNRRILAVDLDFREPSLNAHFQVDVSHGLAEVLGGTCPLKSAILKTDLPSLDLILPTDQEDPHLLLKTQRFADIFTTLRESYDLILLDVPALMPVADASMLMPLADGVVLVAMAGKTTKAQLRRAREFCVGMEARILGLVVGNLRELMPEYTDDKYYYPYRKGNRPDPEGPADSQS